MSELKKITTTKMIDHLQISITDLGPLELSRFKRELANRLPDVAKAALLALNRQALHATVLGFEHPRTGETLRFESPLPDDMAALLSALRG